MKDFKVREYAGHGFYHVKNSENKYGVIDEHDNIIAPFIYDWIGSFREGYAEILVGGLHGFINAMGEEVITPTYIACDYVSDGVAWVVADNGFIGYVDMEGTLVIPALFETGYQFRQGLARVHKNGRDLYIDKELNYYDLLNKERINCEECVCYNDKVVTGLCCEFGK